MSKMKRYQFYVNLCGGTCGGVITVKAKDEDDAYEKAMDSVVNRLVKAFPELSIDYNVEMLDESEDE